MLMSQVSDDFMQLNTDPTEIRYFYKNSGHSSIDENRYVIQYLTFLLII